MKYWIIFLLLSFCSMALSCQTVYEDHMDGEIYVKMKDLVKMESQQLEFLVDYSSFDLFKELEPYDITKVVRPFYYVDDKFQQLQSIYRVEFSQIEKVDQLIKELNKDTSIDYVEKIPLLELAETPNDPGYFLQLHFDDLGAEKAWDLATGSPVITVGVVDFGFDTDHEDMVGVFLQGHNMVDNSTDISPDPFYEDHGTKMAGMIAANKNNEIGVASLASGVKILPLKMSNSSATGFEGIFKAAYEGCQIINCSWNSSGRSSTHSKLLELIYYHFDCLIVASAGNDGLYNLPKQPCKFPGVISVANVFDDGHRFPSSNYGDFVDLCAPGSAIYSTSNENDYDFCGGTSASCANTTSLLALVWSMNPNASSETIKNIVLSSAKKLDWEGSGKGIISAERAVTIMYSSVLNQSNSINGFRIFPNPASGYLKFHFSSIDSELIEIQIYKSDGSLVENAQVSEYDRVNIYNYSKGVYIVKAILDDGTSYSEVFVKY